MKKLIELKEAYPNTFKSWMNERDIIEILDSKWTSRESWYLMKNGIGTQDVREAELIDDDGTDATCKGYFNVRIEGDYIKVYLNINLLGWDDEEQNYLCESANMIGWD